MIEIKHRDTGAVLKTVHADTLVGAYLHGADLFGAYLFRANLGGANLGRANLGRADLSGADLSGADLSGADLSGADLSGADLSGADLRGADLGGADLGGANLGDWERGPDGYATRKPKPPESETVAVKDIFGKTVEVPTSPPDVSVTIQYSNEAARRKGQPLARGVLRYFPDALLAVAEVSRIGNEQHHPGQPLHWDKSKSSDEADALLRHLLDAGTFDSDGLRHTAKVAWRALALLQREIDAEKAQADKVKT